MLTTLTDVPSLLTTLTGPTKLELRETNISSDAAPRPHYWQLAISLSFSGCLVRSSWFSSSSADDLISSFRISSVATDCNVGVVAAW